MSYRVPAPIDLPLLVLQVLSIALPFIIIGTAVWWLLIAPCAWHAAVDSTLTLPVRCLP